VGLFDFLFLSAGVIAVVIVLTVAARYFNKARARLPIARVLDGESTRAAWILSLPIAAASLMGLAAAWALLFVAFICFMYAIGLGLAEVGLLATVLPPTAGNILFHTTFPAQMFLMGLFLMLLVLGAFQIVIGPIPARALVFMRIDKIRTLVRRLAGLLALTAALELLRTVVAGAILAPEGLLEFFARGGETPLTDPTAFALLAAGTILGAVLVIIAARGRR
jgi:uncharacterized membrane protein YqhA